jgi:diguanylate cyclase (GGDEF)-like protein
MHLQALWRRRWRPERPSDIGQLLMLSVGVLVCGTAPLLVKTDQEWLTLSLVSAAMAVILTLSFFVRWQAIRGEWTLAFPLGIFIAVAVLSTGGHKLGATYGGVFVLCFAFTGLTQSAGINLSLIPVAALAYLAANDDWSAAIGIRLVIVISVWVLLSQLLRVMTARNQALTVALRASAHTDPLTGLANRRELDLRLGRARDGDALILCDLDFFKRYNDEHGHLAGDRLLRDFSFLLRAMLRDGDFAARFGGEEFALLLPDTDADQARAVLGRLREKWALLQPGVTFSAGVAPWTTDVAADVTLAAADQALYAAKEHGRNHDRLAGAVTR